MAQSLLDAELAKSAQRVITHMNNDHGASLVAWARFYAELDAKAARDGSSPDRLISATAERLVP